MIKVIKKYKGGGGSSTVQTIPDWMRPYLEKGLQKAQTAQESGQLSQVAGFTPAQLAAQQQAIGTAAPAQNVVAASTLQSLGTLSDIAGGREVVPASTGATQALKAAAERQAQIALGGMQARDAKQGAIGGGRQILARGELASDLAAKEAGIDYQDLQSRRQAAQSAALQGVQAGSTAQQQLMSAADTLQSVGTAQQKQTQAELDKEYQGLSRYSSLIQGTPWQSQQQTQTGGK